MPERAVIEVTNLDIYGNEAMPWSRARDHLANDVPTSVLGTVRPDGRPHAAVVGARWHEGDIYFTSSPDARKARNLIENPACTLTFNLEGIDVTLEGDATRVTDAATLEAVAETYRRHGWPVTVAGDAITAPYNAPSAGPPPWNLYRVTFHTAFGGGTAEPYGATRWRFAR